SLARYVLPAPPVGDKLRDAIRASLRVLDLAPDGITAPLLGAVYRAVLAPADYALHLCGPTGAGKSELAALCQQHSGAGLDARSIARKPATRATRTGGRHHPAPGCFMVQTAPAPAWPRCGGSRRPPAPAPPLCSPPPPSPPPPPPASPTRPTSRNLFRTTPSP